MNHSFDVEIAEKYGLKEAILIANFQFWIEKNRANGKHFHEGRFWTYNSSKALAKLFPYMSESSIKRALQHLEDEGIIIKGNFNKSQYDRTNWYAFSDEGEWLSEQSNDSNQSIDCVKSNDETVQNERPIPDINTDSKPNSKPDDAPYVEIILSDDSYYEITQDILDYWQNAYPHLDVLLEFQNMAGWCMTNPGKRKTRRGMNRFIRNWLTRSKVTQTRSGGIDFDDSWEKFKKFAGVEE